MTEIPEKVKSWIGKPVIKVEKVLTAEKGLWQNFCAAVQDGNPLYWDPQPELVDDGPIAPPALLPAWVTAHDWYPGIPDQKPHTLELHFMLKEEMGLPHGIVGEAETVYGRPVRAGDELRAEQVLREISDEYQTRLGPGRKWIIDINFYHQDGALAGVQSLHFTAYRKE